MRFEDLVAQVKESYLDFEPIKVIKSKQNSRNDVEE